MSDFVANPDYFGPRSEIVPRQTRRAAFHDYREPRVYMFTLNKNPAVPLFSTVAGDPKIMRGVGSPYITLSSLGDVLAREIDKIESLRRDKIEIYRYVIMPDHVHILLRVKERLDHPITSYLAITESRTTSRCRQLSLILPDQSVFDGRGINDRILSGRNQLDVLSNYIADNPRRLLIRRLYPDLYHRNLGVRLAGHEFDCVGNIFLLRKPLFQVHVRRAWTADETAAYIEKCQRLSRSGYVMVSPFIHPAEREIMKMVIDRGGEVIKITDRGFGERWKPAGKDFDLCAEGRLLVMAESGSDTRKTDMTYVKASHLNVLAEHLCASPQSGETPGSFRLGHGDSGGK